MAILLLFQTNDKLYKCALLENIRDNLSKKIKIRKNKTKNRSVRIIVLLWHKYSLKLQIHFCFLLFFIKKKNIDSGPSIRMGDLQKNSRGRANF